MSGIAKNALRLMEAAKFVTNNATNYLRSSWNMGNRFNHTKNKLNEYWISSSTDENIKALPIEDLTSEHALKEIPILKLVSRKMGDFHVRIESGNLGIETPEEALNFGYQTDLDHYISKELIETKLEDEHFVHNPASQRMMQKEIGKFKLLLNTEESEIVLTTPAGDKSVVFNQKLQYGVYKDTDENLLYEINNPNKKPLSIQSGKFNLLFYDCEMVTFDQEGPQDRRIQHGLLYNQFGEKIPNEFTLTPLISPFNEYISHKVVFNSAKILVKTQESDEIFYYKHSIDMEYRSHKILNENSKNNKMPLTDNFLVEFNVGNLFLKTQKDDETYTFNHEVLFEFEESDYGELMPYVSITPHYNYIQN